MFFWSLSDSWQVLGLGFRRRCAGYKKKISQFLPKNSLECHIFNSFKMSGRPKRTRTVPQRFGFENSGQILDEEDDLEIEETEESPPQKANKVSRIKKEEEDVGRVQRIKKEEDVIDLTQLGPESHPPAQLASPSSQVPVTSPNLSSYAVDASFSPVATVPKQPGPRKTITLTRAKVSTNSMTMIFWGYLTILRRTLMVLVLPLCDSTKQLIAGTSRCKSTVPRKVFKLL